jgi:hypothetical protein
MALNDTSSTQISNPRLLTALRVVGWLVVALSGALLALNIPSFYQYVVEGVQNSPTLMATGIPPEAFAALRSLIRRFGELGFFALSVTILLRSRDLMALLLAMTWAALALILSGAVIELSADAALRLPVNLLTILGLSFGALLLLTMPSGTFSPRWARPLPFVLIAFEGVRVTLIPFGMAWVAVLTVPTLLIMGIGIASQINRYHHGSPIYRHQFKWLILGASVSLFAIAINLLCYLIVPRDFHVLTAGIDELGSIALAVTMIIAVTRYRLYDINLFIHRTIVYWLVLIAVGLVFGAQFVIVQTVLGSLLGDYSSVTSLIVPAFITGALYNPLRARIQHVIDRRVYGFRFDLDELERGQQLPPVPNPGFYTGRVLDGFRLEGVIGRGGMGEVYRGVRGEQVAAVKIVAAGKHFDPVYLKRFEREGQMTAALHHPNIVRTYSYGANDGLYYLALEYIDGQDLGDVLKQRGRLGYEDVLDFFSQLADALDAAHARGVIHRDLKPSNVMLRLRADGETYDAVLMDFGIAKMGGVLETELPHRGSTTLTGTGAVGTIAYMSPEQIQQSATVDQRSDVYALGALLCELLTGEPPFTGNPAQVLFAHLQQPASDPLERVPDLPLQAAQVILRALAKHPDDRFQSAGEMAAALLR